MNIHKYSYTLKDYWTYFKWVSIDKQTDNLLDFFWRLGSK